MLIVLFSLFSSDAKGKEHDNVETEIKPFYSKFCAMEFGQGDLDLLSGKSYGLHLT